MKHQYKPFLLLIVCLFYINFISSAQNDKQEAPYYELILSIEPENKLIHNKMILVIDSSQLINRKLNLNLTNAAEIKSIKAEGLLNTVIHSSDGILKQIILSFDKKLSPQLSIKIEYELEIPDMLEGNMISQDWIMLNKSSFWYPSFDDFNPFKYSMQLELDNSYQVISGDYLLTPKKAVDNYLLMSRISRTDIAFSAAKGLQKIEGEHTMLHALKTTPQLDSLVSWSDNSVKFLANYIKKPNDFNHKRQIVLNSEDVNCAFKNYIVLSDTGQKTQKEMYRYFVYEYAQYWFSVANPDSKHAWLSESFAEYLSLIFLREKHGDQFFEQAIKKKREKIANDTTALLAYEGRPSHNALHLKGPIILHQFEQHIGKKQFRRLLNRMIDLRINTNEKLYNLISTEFNNLALDELHRLRSTI